MDISEQNANELSETEKTLKVKIPKVLKNILAVNGYTSLRLIAKMTDEDVENVEKLSREVLPNLIELGQHKEYFGIVQLIGSHQFTIRRFDEQEIEKKIQEIEKKYKMTFH
ncbi:unnamed protein product [Psylliodes chrysocephalus]|uniref:Uncharacterized protein n=1 Tax=Psylliodes chrysocephalus TaxID=3402493 RepID=A0A9P0CPF2_9CUCU|nr:unnamed protein product [Psylliodes chrysocephala]